MLSVPRPLVPDVSYEAAQEKRLSKLLNFRLGIQGNTWQKQHSAAVIKQQAQQQPATLSQWVAAVCQIQSGSQEQPEDI